VSDLEHRAWVQQHRDSYVRVQIPAPFLDAHAELAGRHQADLPAPLHGLLVGACASAANLPSRQAVTVACPKELLRALADYAEECVVTWDARASYGGGTGHHVASASALAAHLRHTIRRETT
jgi:hypothetical protein